MTAVAALLAGLFAVASPRVLVDYQSLPGYPEPHTPRQYNRTFYLRYSTGSKPDTILVLMPGVFLGATAFDGLARQLVAQAPRVEVWAVDRRSNQLEVRNVSREALRMNDASPAYRYFVTQAGKAGGFQPAAAGELRFMSHWGLDTHLQDLHRVVLAARKRAKRVIVCGHSLGASVASLYAAAKIEPGRTGQEFVDGLLLLDGLVGRTGGGAGADIARAISDLETGKTDVYNAAVTRYLTEREARNLMALTAPDALAPADFVAFPASNLAVAGLYESANTSPLPLLSSTVGEAIGARLTSAPRPAGSVLRIAPGLRNVAGLDEGARRIDWRTAAAGDQPVDLRAYLRSDVQPAADFGEWYFPSRLTLDLTSVTVPFTNLSGFVPNSEVQTPTLIIGAGKGYMTSPETFAAYAQVRPPQTIAYEVVASYTHMDVLTANRENGVIPLLRRWLDRLPIQSSVARRARP